VGAAGREHLEVHERGGEPDLDEGLEGHQRGADE